MKRFALQTMRGFGAFALTRSMSAGMARILMYHNFSDSSKAGWGAVEVPAIREQLEYLRRHFRVVPLAYVAERLKEGHSFDPHTVALTVDDGRRNFYQFFFPLLKEFSMPATFFVVSSFISGEDWVWTDKVLWLSDQPLAARELSQGEIEKLFQRLNQTSPEDRNMYISAFAARIGIAIPHEAPAKYAPCSWAELREMSDSGLVEIGSHTVTHPILASTSDEASFRELTCSRTQIEGEVGKRVTSFCFPNGKPGDYRLSQVQQVIDAGYGCAVVASPGLVGSGANPYELPRIGISSNCDDLSFSKQLDGVEYYQEKLQRVFRKRVAPV